MIQISTYPSKYKSNILISYNIGLLYTADVPALYERLENCFFITNKG